MDQRSIVNFAQHVLEKHVESLDFLSVVEMLERYNLSDELLREIHDMAVNARLDAYVALEE